MQRVHAAPILKEKRAILQGESAAADKPIGAMSQERSAGADKPVGVTSYIAGFFAVGGSIPFNRR